MQDRICLSRHCNFLFSFPSHFLRSNPPINRRLWLAPPSAYLTVGTKAKGLPKRHSKLIWDALYRTVCQSLFKNETQIKTSEGLMDLYNGFDVGLSFIGPHWREPQSGRNTAETGVCVREHHQALFVNHNAQTQMCMSFLMATLTKQQLPGMNHGFKLN